MMPIMLVRLRRIILVATIVATSLMPQAWGEQPDNVHADCRAYGNGDWEGVQGGAYCADEFGGDCCAAGWDTQELPACTRDEPVIYENRRCHYGQGYCYSCDPEGEFVIWVLIGIACMLVVGCVVFGLFYCLCRPRQQPDQVVMMQMDGQGMQMSGGPQMMMVPAGGPQMMMVPQQQMVPAQQQAPSIVINNNMQMPGQMPAPA